MTANNSTVDYHKVPVFSIRMEQDIFDRLKEQAQAHGISKAEVVRRLILNA